MNRYFIFIFVFFWSTVAIAKQCDELVGAKDLDCISGFINYADTLDHYSETIRMMDSAGLAKLGEELEIRSDTSIKCASIRRDEMEFHLLKNVLLAEGSLFSSIRAYLKYEIKIRSVIQEHISSNYADLVRAVSIFNKHKQDNSSGNNHCVR